MARMKSTPVELPGSTMVELVGSNGTKSVKMELTLDDARKKKAELESEKIPPRTPTSKPVKKWRGWYFQIYQLGFSSHKSNDDQKGNPRK